MSSRAFYWGGVCGLHGIKHLLVLKSQFSCRSRSGSYRRVKFAHSSALLFYLAHYFPGVVTYAGFSGACRHAGQPWLPHGVRWLPGTMVANQVSDLNSLVGHWCT